MAACLKVRARTALTLVILVLSTFVASSQQQTNAGPPLQDAPEPSKPFKLHVYANLVQVPTLVLFFQGKAAAADRSGEL